jgi:hypothetical protein
MVWSFLCVVSCGFLKALDFGAFQSLEMCILDAQFANICLLSAFKENSVSNGKTLCLEVDNVPPDSAVDGTYLFCTCSETQ